jgi:ATP:ADP antiporter, AAA family
LRPLKDAIFIQLVDKLHLPYAKTVSVIALMPLVMFYTKLLEKISREKMLIILPTFYGITVLCFATLMPFFSSRGSRDRCSIHCFLFFN